MQLHTQRWAVRPPRLWGRVFSGLLVFACIAIAMPAEAQLLPYDVNRSPVVYEALPIGGGTATTLPISGDSGTTRVDLPFAFDFFGQSYNFVNVNVNGWASVVYSGNRHWSDSTFPYASGDPNGTFALWWDDLDCPSGGLKWQLLGNAPNRQAVVEWNCMDCCGGAATLHMQLWLTEGTSTVEMRYGPSTDTETDEATVGIESQDGLVGWAGLSCTPRCTASNWPAAGSTGSSIVYSQGPDLALTQLQTEPVIYAGVATPVRATVINRGGGDALGFGAEFWLSTDPVLSANDWPLGAAPGTKDAGRSATVTFETTVTVPGDVPEGPAYLIARIDPANAVGESNKGNNVGSTPVIISSPKSDLTVASIVAPAAPQADHVLRFSWTARNMGNLVAPNVPYSIVLSRNGVVTSTDPVIGGGTITLPPLTDLEKQEVVTLPETIREGAYTLGVILDPLQALVEIDETNNVGASADQFWLVSNELEIATAPQLPVGYTGSTYCMALEARGGTGLYSWTIDSGALPAGIELVTEGIEGEQTTLLCGTASQVGTFAFHATVVSGQLTAGRNFTLQIEEGFAPLTVITTELPAAGFQLPYHTVLQVSGGNAPYEWRLAAGVLPEGLSLTRGGQIDGTPSVDGTFRFTAEVKDAANHVAQRELQLVVASPSALTCMSHTLPAMMVGQAVDAQLVAGGGAGSYQWKSVSWARLAAGNDDGESGGQGVEDAPVSPPGFQLGADGSITGTARRVGSYQWKVQVNDARNSSDTCVLSFDVGFENGPTIGTMQLADALVGVPYRAHLQVDGASGAVAWKIAPDSKLPDGFTLDKSSGDINGLASEELLEGEKVRTFAFVVEVRDDANRMTSTALSITVRKEQVQASAGGKTGGKDDGGGCQSGNSAPGLLALGFGLLALRRRRG